jgi:hypothetical protein
MRRARIAEVREGGDAVARALSDGECADAKALRDLGGRARGESRRLGGLCVPRAPAPEVWSAGKSGELCESTKEEAVPLAIAGTGYGLIGILVIVLLVVLIFYFVRRA